MKKTILVAAAWLLLASLLFSCARTTITNPPEQAGTTPEPDVSAPSPEPDVETLMKDSLPERDFEGVTVNIIAAAEQWQDRYVREEMTGETLNDAIYSRNVAVSERFNAELNYQIFNGWSAGKEPVKTALSGSVLSGGGDYDLTTGLCSYATDLLGNKLLSDLKTVEYLDLSAPWWFDNINQKVSINNQLFLGAGAWGMRNFGSAIIVFFNQTVKAKYNLEDPYSAVLEGTWTWDKMIGMAQSVVTDEDGNGEYNEFDTTGIVSTANYFRMSSHSMDYDYTTIEEDGSITFNPLSEKIIDISEKFYSLFSGINKDLYMDVAEITTRTTTNEDQVMAEAFASDHVLFMDYVLEMAEFDVIRNMEGYGIIPPPKYDENQNTYYTMVLPETAGIPFVVKDAECSAIILEALQSETYRNTRPAYYDVVLKGKYLRDEVSGQMLDLIFENIICSTSYVYDVYFGYYIGTAESISSLYESQLKSYQGTVDKLVKKLRK